MAQTTPALSPAGRALIEELEAVFMGTDQARLARLQAMVVEAEGQIALIVGEAIAADAADQHNDHPIHEAEDCHLCAVLADLEPLQLSSDGDAVVVEAGRIEIDEEI